MKNYLRDRILKGLNKKMVIISGLRQVGKTYLAKDVMKAFSISTIKPAGPVLVPGGPGGWESCISLPG